MHRQEQIDQAAEDVRVIRDMMEKAGSSLRESSSFFLWAGLIFLVSFIRSILQNLLVAIIPFSGHNIALVAYAGNFFGILEIIGIIVLYFVYRAKARRMGETIGKRLCSLWSFLLVGGFFVGRLLPTVLQITLGSQLDGGSMHIAALMPHFIRCLLIAAGLFVTGLLTDKFSWKVFAVLAILLTLVVLILARFTVEIPLQAAGASMSLAPATYLLTIMPAAALLIIWAVVKRK